MGVLSRQALVATTTIWGSGLKRQAGALNLILHGMRRRENTFKGGAMEEKVRKDGNRLESNNSRRINTL